MPTINASELNFFYVAQAAHRAREQGDAKAADELDAIARRIDAAVQNRNAPLPRRPDGMKRIRLWSDVESVFTPAQESRINAYFQRLGYPMLP